MFLCAKLFIFNRIVLQLCLNIFQFTERFLFILIYCLLYLIDIDIRLINIYYIIKQIITKIIKYTK